MNLKDLIMKIFLGNNKNNLIQDWSFQDVAIRNIISDFKEKPNSRNLVVVPTGGGKTITAIRVINKMINDNFLAENQRAIWIVHTKALKVQTEKERDSIENIKKFNLDKRLSKILEIRMKTDANHLLVGQSADEYKLLIIDEAHHSAANTYQNFFNEKMGVLGLTATPTRTDEASLSFDKISYSITFRELVRRGVILLPEFKSVETNISIDAKSLNFSKIDTELDKFDIDERNDIIANEIFKRSKIFKKVIVFVGTNNHVRSLYKVLVTKNKFNNNPYKHIGYIYSGDKNEKMIKNEVYLEDHKQYNSSILVNCRLLNEGYDDPTIDTVVMAVPTNSLLYYMQCIGRVVRNTLGEMANRAYVLEMYDNLPNIHYRIDNRWLFAEISDCLEPEIIDKQCLNYKDFKNSIDNILRTHNVEKRFFESIPENNNFNDISVLLFNGVPESKESTWKPIFITPENRERYVNLFNEITYNIDKYHKGNLEYILFDKLKVSRDDFYFSDRKIRIAFIAAIRRAYEKKNENKRVDCLKYVSFREKKLSLWDKIVYFLQSFAKHIYGLLLNKK